MHEGWDVTMLFLCFQKLPNKSLVKANLSMLLHHTTKHAPTYFTMGAKDGDAAFLSLFQRYPRLPKDTEKKIKISASENKDKKTKQNLTYGLVHAVI